MQKTHIDTVDAIRLKIDYLIQFADAIRTSPEKTLAFRELQMAKSWAGFIKAKAGEISPYTPAKDAKDIPPTAEVWGGLVEISSYNLDNVNLMRAKIEEIIFEVEQLHLELKHWEHSTVFFPCFERLKQAQFWYGFELANIRNTANQ